MSFIIQNTDNIEDWELPIAHKIQLDVTIDLTQLREKLPREWRARITELVGICNPRLHTGSMLLRNVFPFIEHYYGCIFDNFSNNFGPSLQTATELVVLPQKNNGLSRVLSFEHLQLESIDIAENLSRSRHTSLYICDLEKLRAFYDRSDFVYTNIRIMDVPVLEVLSHTLMATQVYIQNAPRLVNLDVNLAISPERNGVHPKLTVQNAASIETIAVFLDYVGKLHIENTPKLKRLVIKGNLFIGDNNDNVILNISSLNTFIVEGEIRGRTSLVQAFIQELVYMNPSLTEVMINEKSIAGNCTNMTKCIEAIAFQSTN